MPSRSEIAGKLLLTVACLAVAADLVEGANWPRFRGPNGTGISSDKNIPIEIGEGRNLLWKIAVPGAGNSSPIVVDGRIYLQTASEDSSQRMLLCLSLADGKELWKRTAPGAAGPLHAKNTLASSTATVADGRVFMPFWNGADLSLAAYDTEGKPLWNRPLGPYNGEHGAAENPVVVGDKVVLVVDQNGSSEVQAFYAADGKPAWNAKRPGSKQACYSTPVLLERSGSTPDLVVVSTTAVTAYDPDTGAVRWNWKNVLTLRTVASPIVAQGMLFVTGGNGPGDRHAVGIPLDPAERERLGGKPLWENRKVFPYVPCMVTRGEHLYFVNDSGIGGCYVAKTGDKVWEQRLGIGNVTSSPLLVDGQIYVAGEDGALKVFAAEPEYKERWSTELTEGVMATPAVADGRMVLRGKQHLYCFGKK